MSTTANPPQPLPGMPEVQVDYKALADKLQARLEMIYSPERVVEWLEEGTPLPEVRADPVGTIKFRGSLGAKLNIQRPKDRPKVVVMTIITPLRGCPLAELADLSDSQQMDVKISPRYLQTGLPLGFGVLAPAGEDELETDISDETLQVRLTTLSSRTGELPEDWRAWPQSKKDEVGRWAWAMILRASDNDVKVPTPPEDVAIWYWGEEGVAAQREAADNQANGWANDRPPELTDEQAAAIRDKVQAASQGGGGSENGAAPEAQKPELAGRASPASRSGRSRRGKKR